MVPRSRYRSANSGRARPDGDFVLYWMIAHRRPSWNFGIDRAVEWAHELGKPLVILEALRVGYPWASDRLHQFILQGMDDNQQAFSRRPVTYYPYVEPNPGDGAGLVEALARRAAVLVTDDFPCFFLPRMVRSLADRVSVLVEEVDSNGLLPMRTTDRAFARAFDFRRYLQKSLKPHLAEWPHEDALKKSDLPQPISLPREITDRWPVADRPALSASKSFLSGLPIDHAVTPSEIAGGHGPASRQFARFLDQHLDRYAEERSEPEQEVTSGLSPYLHFGHIGIHEILAGLAQREEWTPQAVGGKTSGQREGWWNMSPAAESFLDELVTWREIGYNMCVHRSDYDRYESLPRWAIETLADHENDRREFVYKLEEFESGRTHDPLWNAAQLQIVREGRMHNYLRMLWGKKILEWSPTPRDALTVMIELNNKYALDGRNPNSYSGIFWVLGRYDRAWGPERPIYGKIRYMSSENTARKFSVKNYVARYGS